MVSETSLGWLLVMLMRSEESNAFICSVFLPNSCGFQAYPRIYEAALQGCSALQQICKQGPVDVSDLATRLTAGDLLLCTCH